MKFAFPTRLVAAVAVAVLIVSGTAVERSAAIGGFDDVASGQFYSDAVVWMVDEGITTGTGPGEFSPALTLTRGQLATFVWRYAGSMSGIDHPFTDVPSDAFYSDAVRWMYGTGITTGTSATTFSPDLPVTRAEAAAFLWRYDGQPTGGPHPFVDVPSTAFYADAVAWMNAERVTTGTTATTFSPQLGLTRAEFATFLYRYEGSPEVESGGDPGPGGESGGTPTPVPSNAVFFEDFVDGASMSRFDFDIYHRDDAVQAAGSWSGDHAITGPDDACGPPDTQRTITRGSRASDFNDDWIYRCAPGGNLDKAHVMTSIGDTSGYSIGAFTPKETFTNVREVRWDVNITDLGGRQWTEVKIIPVALFDFQNLPCAVEWLPCAASSYASMQTAVGTTFFDQAQDIVTNNGRDGDPFYWRESYEPGSSDPALASKMIRRKHYLRDNGNGTLSFGIETENGSYNIATSNGSFPTGPVKVVFADHNYTPDKDGTPIGHTWHWDNIAIFD